MKPAFQSSATHTKQPYKTRNSVRDDHADVSIERGLLFWPNAWSLVGGGRQGRGDTPPTSCLVSAKPSHYKKRRPSCPQASVLIMAVRPATAIYTLHFL
jgi:hypothetical protein